MGRRKTCLRVKIYLQICDLFCRRGQLVPALMRGRDGTMGQVDRSLLPVLSSSLAAVDRGCIILYNCVTFLQYMHLYETPSFQYPLKTIRHFYVKYQGMPVLLDLANVLKNIFNGRNSIDYRH